MFFISFNRIIYLCIAFCDGLNKEHLFQISFGITETEQNTGIGFPAFNIIRIYLQGSPILIEGLLSHISAEKSESFFCVVF